MSKPILVLEDDRDMLRLYTKVLTKAGYQVHTAQSLEEASRLLREIVYAVFVCDMHVEDGNSSHLLRDKVAQLKQAGTGVIIISGHEKYRTLTTDLEVDFFLSKPVSIHDLVRYIHRLTQTNAKGGH